LIMLTGRVAASQPEPPTLLSLHRGLRQLLPSGTPPSESTPMANTQPGDNLALIHITYLQVWPSSSSLFQSFT
jgi:hypothetical protein